MTLARLQELVRAAHLDIFGILTPEDLPPGRRSLILLGPHEPGFWPHVLATPEFQDGLPDPMDRWSDRVIRALAADLNGEAFFPFGGPPYAPFIRWAQESGRCWPSPVGLLVHDAAGLMVSFRGAIALSEPLETGTPGQSPCEACTERPCETACPVGALGPGQLYDVPKCKAHVQSEAGKSCRDAGCLVRRACPVSSSYGRLAAQSAHHMRYFAP